jgi:hypothetical protein
MLRSHLAAQYHADHSFDVPVIIVAGDGNDALVGSGDMPPSARRILVEEKLSRFSPGCGHLAADLIVEFWASANKTVSMLGTIHMQAKKFQI